MSTKVILTPSSVAIVLDKISKVSEVYLMWSGRHTGYSGVTFQVHDIHGETTSFNYEYAKYAEDSDTLLKKVENIRSQILRLINDGNEVKEINGGISLKKEEAK